MEDTQQTTDIWFKIYLTLRHKINPIDWEKNSKGKSIFIYRMTLAQWKKLKRDFSKDYITDIKYELERTKDLIY